MTKGTAAAVAAGVIVAGGGTYAYFAHKNGWWPFKKKAEETGEGGVPNPPGMPTVQVSVIDQNKAEATVSWGAVSGATYYKVFVDNKEVASNVQGTSVKLTDLVPGKTYRVSVAACN